MKIFGTGTETYLYINGLIINEEIQLNDNKFLMPIQSKVPLQKLSNKVKKDIDFSIVVLCSRTLNSQMKIINENPKKLTISAWNSQWDLILLSAIYKCEVICNLQCTHPIEAINDDAILEVTNYYMHGFFKESYTITKDDAKWLNKYFNNAQSLLANDSFCTAVHSLASYQWHSMPRVQMAILWAGIESLFQINSELNFRISLYISNFLAGNDKEKARQLFKEIKELYNKRSSAVHGDTIKGDLISHVEKSATLLNELITYVIGLGKV